MKRRLLSSLFLVLLFANHAAAQDMGTDAGDAAVDSGSDMPASDSGDGGTDSGDDMANDAATDMPASDTGNDMPMTDTGVDAPSSDVGTGDMSGDAGTMFKFEGRVLLENTDEGPAAEIVLTEILSESGMGVVDAGMSAGDAGTNDAGDAGTSDIGDVGTSDGGDVGTRDAGDVGMSDVGPRPEPPREPLVIQASTDSEREFSISVPQGEYELVISVAGYQTYEEPSFVVASNQYLDVTLLPDIDGDIILNFLESASARIVVEGPRGNPVDEQFDVNSDQPITLTVPVGDYRITVDRDSDGTVNFDTPLIMRRIADQSYEFTVTFTDPPQPTPDIDTQCACSTADDSRTPWLLLVGIFAVATLRTRRRC